MSRRLRGDVVRWGTLRDPLSQGVAEIQAMGRAPVYFEEGSEDFIDGQLVFRIQGPSDELFKKIKASPVRAQTLPLVWEHPDPTMGGFIQLRGINRFQHIQDDLDNYLELLGSFRVLDNLQFLDAVQTEREKYKEVGDRDGQ